MLRGFNSSNLSRSSLDRSILIASCLGLGMVSCAAIASAQAAPANKPATTQQNPPATQSKPADANPFPEDTNSVPVMPSKDTPPIPEGASDGDAVSVRVPVPGTDSDPVRSPDDASSASAEPAGELASSSSSAGLDKILPGADDDDSQPQGKHRKMAVPGPEHKETAAEDIEVGKYSLETKNWKGALSRFQSAMVLSPDDPDVYWGLAESSRHLGHLADARGYYQKLAEYDPTSKHGKEAIKALKEPEIANAKVAAPVEPAK
jgi:hypothetical protein